MQQMRVQPRQVEKGGPTFRTRDGFPNAVERREYLGQIAVHRDDADRFQAFRGLRQRVEAGGVGLVRRGVDQDASPCGILEGAGFVVLQAKVSASNARSATERPYQPTVSSVVEISLTPSALTAFQVGFIA